MYGFNERCVSIERKIKPKNFFFDTKCMDNIGHKMGGIKKSAVKK